MSSDFYIIIIEINMYVSLSLLTEAMETCFKIQTHAVTPSRCRWHDATHRCVETFSLFPRRGAVTQHR